MSDAIVHVSDASFEADVLKAEGPVLVDFWAAWCGPCKMIAPVLDELAGELAGKITIAKMDVDANKETPAKFNIRGIPTLMIFKGGQMESMKVGALSKSQLVEFINSAL
ncbi:thioredoxin TrxA [Simiduia sp. 21SJ11W-1]|jgi:thioredoxin 1|uniref:thioredoxin TrxA n=1 Tax=Simiduia sp. 21SJ11W-1 TaxID=2909669 RepID=UPI0020A0C5CB|nr:thioredoxin TrxA [Simiduia sp. 21SJ11W-1]UTA48209.1 thioredoxin TrxA [Simiduia sp. 21SJ11W-1]